MIILVFILLMISSAQSFAMENTEKETLEHVLKQIADTIDDAILDPRIQRTCMCCISAMSYVFQNNSTQKANTKTDAVDNAPVTKPTSRRRNKSKKTARRRNKSKKTAVPIKEFKLLIREAACIQKLPTKNAPCRLPERLLVRENHDCS